MDIILIGNREVKNVLKPTIVFLLILSLGLVFGGTVAAALTVNVNVVDVNGTPITVSHPGTQGGIDVVASTNNESVNDPQALITTKPDEGLVYDTANASMTTNGIDWISNSDPVQGGFLTWSDQDGAWFWAISSITGPLEPENTVRLFIPVVVAAVGEITTDVIFEGGILDDDTNPAPAEDSYTFLSTSENASAKTVTVPMQNTGAPLALAALGLLGILGGTIYSRRR